MNGTRFVIMPTMNAYCPPMSDADSFARAYPRDLADAIAFSLRFEGHELFHQTDEYMPAIAAGRVVRHLGARALSS